ncbi:hypothetical protein AAIH32_04635 [Pseudarthrobacter oxydans]|uniref:hypothetical protein n=1 Tax=Pseudarthrobacter oxydans TaxID=1671 RepID=UPI003D2E15A9
MSISIGHRAIFSAFGHRHRTSAPRPAAPARRREETPALVEIGELKCSPWEGLYLEQARPVTQDEQEAGTERTLDAFLSSLMYGE